MNDNQKQLLIGGAILIVLSSFYLAFSSIPNSAQSALLFPLSILGVFFGLVFVLWSVAWILLRNFKVLK